MLIIGGEWNYVIFSTVRSLPRYRIEKKPTLGWCKKSLGFISDEHQINVALTRARRGLIIIGWCFFLIAVPVIIDILNTNTWFEFKKDYEIINFS